MLVVDELVEIRVKRVGAERRERLEGIIFDDAVLAGRQGVDTRVPVDLLTCYNREGQKGTEKGMMQLGFKRMRGGSRHRLRMRKHVQTNHVSAAGFGSHSTYLSASASWLHSDQQ